MREIAWDRKSIPVSYTHLGYPLVDIKVTLYDGSYHEVDSNEMAFKFAGSIAFKEAARKASPVLLEPVSYTHLDVYKRQV